jgi:type II secretory pathway component PulM
VSGTWPLVLLLVFTTHLPFFAWRWRATRERRYAATTLTFTLLVITYGLVVFAPQLRVGHVPLFQVVRVCAWLSAAVSIALLVRHHALRLRRSRA